MSGIRDDNHALAIGILLGMLMKTGFDVEPQADEDGNYMNVLNIDLTLEMGEPYVIQVQVL